MRKLSGVIVAGLFCLAVPALAEVSGTVTFTSEYILRGISQTNDEPAVQASIDFAAKNGFYLGLWGSSIDVSHIGLPVEAQVEMDLYGGWAWTGQSGFGLDVGVVHYDYPGASDINYEEVYLQVSYKVASLKYYYADDFLGFGGNEQYLDGKVEFDVGGGFTLGLHAGYSTFETVVGVPDYTDYKGWIAKSLGKLNLELAYTDSDLDEFGDQADGRVVFSLSVNP